MTATLTYNPRTITPMPTTRSKKQQFEDEFRTAMKHAKAFREGKMEFRSMDALLNEL